MILFCSKIHARNLDDWNNMEMLYWSMKLYNNGVIMNWLEHILSPILFFVCTGVTILLYVTVRPSGLPVFVYVWFPLVAICVMINVSWIVYDVVMIKRATEGVAGTLQSRSEYFYPRLSVCQRKE